MNVVDSTARLKLKFSKLDACSKPFYAFTSIALRKETGNTYENFKSNFRNKRKTAFLKEIFF